MTSWQELKARALGERTHPRPCPITGLLPAEQDARDEAVDRWIARIEAVMRETGCSAAAALKAIETSQKEQE